MGREEGFLVDGERIGKAIVSVFPDRAYAA